MRVISTWRRTATRAEGEAFFNISNRRFLKPIKRITFKRVTKFHFLLKPNEQYLLFRIYWMRDKFRPYKVEIQVITARTRWIEHSRKAYLFFRKPRSYNPIIQTLFEILPIVEGSPAGRIPDHRFEIEELTQIFQLLKGKGMRSL